MHVCVCARGFVTVKMPACSQHELISVDYSVKHSSTARYELGSFAG